MAQIPQELKYAENQHPFNSTLNKIRLKLYFCQQQSSIIRLWDSRYGCCLAYRLLLSQYLELFAILFSPVEKAAYPIIAEFISHHETLLKQSQSP